MSTPGDAETPSTLGDTETPSTPGDTEASPIRQLFERSYVGRRDHPTANTIFTVLAVLVALAMFLAASGSGSEQPAGDTTIPGWVDIAANLASVVFGLLVLVPRTRVVGALLAVANMVVSMYTNYQVDGVDYFVKVIGFNIATIVFASMLAGHYFADLWHLSARRETSN